jgi:NADH-quinone oxidoreductase subunit A
MEALLLEYLPILFFLAIAIGLSLVIVAASYLVAKQRPDSEKASSYECGFEAFEVLVDGRIPGHPHRRLHL